jgi:hypothetical protein
MFGANILHWSREEKVYLCTHAGGSRGYAAYLLIDPETSARDSATEKRLPNWRVPLAPTFRLAPFIKE